MIEGGITIVNQSNLVSVLGWMMFLLWGCVGCVLVLVVPTKKHHFSLPLFWYLTCVLFAFLGAFIFEDFAKLSLHNDTVPFILICLIFYFVVMGISFLCICCQSHQFFPSFFVVFAVMFAFLVFGLSFSAYNKVEDSHPWHHLATIALLIPPAIAGFAIHFCYIKEIEEKTIHHHHHHQNSSSSSSSFSSPPLSQNQPIYFIPRRI